MNKNGHLQILWMIPKWTFPTNDGARVATHSLVKNTIAAGAEVDVLCLAQEGEQTSFEEMRSAWAVDQIQVIYRKIPSVKWKRYLYLMKSFFRNPARPLTFLSFQDEAIQNQIKIHLNNKSYDFILFDGLHLGASFLKNDYFSTYSRPKFIYRAHNIEADLWKKAFKEKRNPLLKLLLLHQARLVEKTESEIISRVQGIAAIAEEDLLQLQLFAKNAKCRHIPLGLDFNRFLPATDKVPIQFLFIGRLDWAPNRDGLEWLLTEIWPKVIERRPTASLKIVGSGNGSWLERYRGIKGINYVGYVPTIDDAYKDCHFTLVPITYGSGTRIKVLESFAFGRKLISTSMGVQGAGLDENDYVRADSREEWIDILSEIELNDQHSKQLETSRNKLVQNYCERKVGERFYEWLSTV